MEMENIMLCYFTTIKYILKINVLDPSSPLKIPICHYLDKAAHLGNHLPQLNGLFFLHLIFESDTI